MHIKDNIYLQPPQCTGFLYFGVPPWDSYPFNTVFRLFKESVYVYHYVVLLNCLFGMSLLITLFYQHGADLFLNVVFCPLVYLPIFLHTDPNTCCYLGISRTSICLKVLLKQRTYFLLLFLRPPLPFRSRFLSPLLSFGFSLGC